MTPRHRQHRFLRTASARAAAVVVALAVAVSALALRAHAAADPFAPERLRATVKTLADTAWTGRGPGTPGLDLAAEYLAQRFADAGLEPFGDRGTWFQEFDIATGVKLSGENHLTTRRGGPWTIERDYLPLGFSASDTVKAPVTFAGYGITAPEFGYDDYANVDVTGTIVLVLRYEPGEDDSTSKFDGRLPTAHSDLRTKAINAREHGALGMLVVTGPRYRTGDEELSRLRSDAGGISSGVVAVTVTRALADTILARHGVTVALLQDAIDGSGRPHSIAYPDSVEIATGLARTMARAKNVVGRRRGADSSRALVVGAHYDHLGLGGESSLAEKAYGRVHPGADDNASGTAALVALAEEKTKPAHDRVFAAFAGEEMGLVGSAWFVEHPPLPLERVSAMLNMDMVGRLRDSKLMVMGVGTAKEFPDLVRAENERLPLERRFNLRPSEDGFGPSDQTSFYKKNVPVLMFFTGAHADYHRPSDTWEKVDAEGLARVASFVSATAGAIDRLPAVTYQKAQGDTTRRMALRGGHGAWLGTIPDYTQSEGGVLLSGVREGSPAQAAGIQGGDSIVKIDAVKIDNIYDFTFVLQQHRPGDTIQVVVKRGAETKTFAVTLGRRAS
jgi:hypothetical protein